MHAARSERLPPTAQVPYYGACGGRVGTPAKQNAADPSYCCMMGSCRYINEWFWQCLPTPRPLPNTARECGWLVGASRSWATVWPRLLEPD